MKKLVHILFFTIISFTQSKAQFCHTPENLTNRDYVSAFISNGSNYGISSYNFFNATIKVKVFFHIIRTSNGSEGRSENLLNDLINNANTAFLPAKIQLVKVGFDFIDNDIYANNYSHTYQFNNLININSHTDAIDIYLLTDRSAMQGGLASNIPGKSLVIPWATTMSNGVVNNVLTHELGHCFNLFHTHQGTTSRHFGGLGCAELVNGSNSKTCGDYVEDTPADPYGILNYNSTTLSFDNPACNNGNCGVNSTFVYNYTNYNSSNILDQNGQSYTPNFSNIMSYGDPSCLSMFTNGQINRMRAALLTNETCLFTTVVDRINGENTLGENLTVNNSQSVFFPTKTYSIIGQGVASTYGNWTISNGITLVEGSLNNSSSISVKGNGGYTNGTITLSLQGNCGTTTFIKQITIDPSANNQNSCTINSPKPVGVWAGFEIELHQMGPYRVLVTKQVEGGITKYFPRGKDFWNLVSRYNNTDYMYDCINVSTSSYNGLSTPAEINFIPAGYSVGYQPDGARYFTEGDPNDPCNLAVAKVIGHQSGIPVEIRQFEGWKLLVTTQFENGITKYFPRGRNFWNWEGFTRYANTEQYYNCINVDESCWSGLCSPSQLIESIPFGYSVGYQPDGARYIYANQYSGSRLSFEQFTGLSEDGKTTISPNPAITKFNVSFRLVKSEQVRFNLYDQMGRNIQTKDYLGQEGSNIVDFDLTNMFSGSYILSIQTSQKMETFKIIKGSE